VIWRNFAGNLSCRPLARHEPQSEDELVALVRRLAASGERLKVVGDGHSPAPIALADGIHQLSLDRMAEGIELDSERGLVRVPGGMRLAELNCQLAAKGFALPSLGSISGQTVAGAIATGTHGSGLGFGSIADEVQSLRLVTAEGSIRSASREHEPELFDAARVGLGALGIISSLTLRCVPAFRLRARWWPSTLDESLDGLDDFVGAEHPRFWWIPHTERTQMWSAERTELPPNSPRGRLRCWAEDVLWENRLHESLLWAARIAPAQVPRVNRLMERLCFRQGGELVGVSFEVFNFLILLKQYVMEYAIPLEYAGAALRDLRSLIEDGFRAQLPVEVRFAKADEPWLSMSQGRETCFIGVISYRPFGREFDYEPYFRAVDELLAGYQGRPHWAKLHYRSAAQLRAAYPRWDRWQSLRQELDPTGMFLNPYLEGLFGLAAGSS